VRLSPRRIAERQQRRVKEGKKKKEEQGKNGAARTDLVPRIPRLSREKLELIGEGKEKKI